MCVPEGLPGGDEGQIGCGWCPGRTTATGESRGFRAPLRIGRRGWGPWGILELDIIGRTAWDGRRVEVIGDDV